ncbi:hypothetical protein L210DRAFT_3519096 [Boletus edulis BED1]|uniref:Uncharacterized protein n=1 Tax=Boletus edulis BED1 TaxID=1328754 RepID=A0AAD4GLN4_BOLED|nr:hypothetical protein L210DRAFT_3519096 [Boletus edulis BED1]
MPRLIQGLIIYWKTCMPPRHLLGVSRQDMWPFYLASEYSHFSRCHVRIIIFRGPCRRHAR